MIDRLSQRDKRAVKIGAVCAVAVLMLVFAAKWFDHWAQVSKSLATARDELEVIRPPKAKQEGLLSIVPVLEMPQSEEKQKLLFRDKFNEQLKKAGIKSEPLQFLSSKKSKGQVGYKILRLRCRCKGNFGQMLDLLADLNKNPYLVGIEEFRIRCNEKKRDQIELDLTVSTFARK